MSSTAQPPKPKRRWCRFSLKTLLVVMLVSCLGFAWIGHRLHRARENRARVAASEKPIKTAVAAIEESGGTVVWKNKSLRPHTWLEEQFDDPGGADDPVGVVKVTEVTFSDDATDADLVHLKDLIALEVVDISNWSTFPDRGKNVTDGGLEHLKGLTHLTKLKLFRRTNVTDAGLEHLKGLTNLEELRLSGTQVSDAGLQHLKGLKSLLWLILEDTDVTDEGVRNLQQALPKCHILY